MVYDRVVWVVRVVHSRRKSRDYSILRQPNSDHQVSQERNLDQTLAAARVKKDTDSR